jgi:hypothetical protein
VSGNILNSKGIPVAVVRGHEIFDLKGKKTLRSKRGQYLSPVRRTGRAFERRERLGEAP